MLTGTDNGSNLMHPEGLAAGAEGYPHAQWDVVGPRYFSTLGTGLVEGRDFTEHDDAAAPRVVAINEAMARRFFSGSSPVGRRLVWGSGGNAQRLEIVAVVRDVRRNGPRDAPQLRFYLPYLQLPVVRSNWMVGSTRYLIRTAVDPSAVAGALRRLVPEEDPRLSITSLEAGGDLVGRTLLQERMLASLLAAFGILAIGLACLGVYGLIAYHVHQRTSEIGIRMALGSPRGAVLWTMLRPCRALDHDRHRGGRSAGACRGPYCAKSVVRIERRRSARPDRRRRRDVDAGSARRLHPRAPCNARRPAHRASRGVAPALRNHT